MDANLRAGVYEKLAIVERDVGARFRPRTRAASDGRPDDWQVANDDRIDSRLRRRACEERPAGGRIDQVSRRASARQARPPRPEAPASMPAAPASHVKPPTEPLAG